MPSTAPRGQVLVIVAVAILILTSVAGLAIDGSRGLWERRQAQNAAEHAALAAAWESCHPSVPAVTPTEAAIDVAADNGFVHDGVTTFVVVTGASGMYTVEVRSRIATTFARLMGFESVTAAGRAVADCSSTSGEGFALFAGGNNCRSLGKYQIEFSGSDNRIDGAIHSNDNIRYNGSNNEMDGEVTYVSVLENGGSDNTFTPAHAQAGPAEWPVVFNLADYRALAEQSTTDDLYFRNGTIDWAYIQNRGDGLYYATDKIDISGSGPITYDLTLVSEKEVIISGSQLDLRPFMHNLLAFSGSDHALKDRCDKEGVKMSGSDNDWRGFIYAPRSVIIMDGSSNSTLVGSLIGWAIKLSGSTLDNTADPSFFAGPPALRLIE